MITDFLITIIYNVVAVVVNIFAILPDVTLPANIQTSLNGVAPYYNGISTIFPVNTLLDILGVELVFIGFYFTYKIVRWAYTKIPGIN